MRERDLAQNFSVSQGLHDRGSPDLGVTLFHWCVIEVAAGNHVVLGVRAGRRTGEISSVITSFCASSRRATTVDGESFYLDGALGANVDADRQHWMLWLEEAGFDGLVDVTPEYVASMQGGLQ